MLDHEGRRDKPNEPQRREERKERKEFSLLLFFAIFASFAPLRFDRFVRRAVQCGGAVQWIGDGGTGMVTLQVRPRSIVIAALALFLLYIVFTQLFDVVLLVLVSLIGLATLNPIVDKIEDRGVPRGLAVMIIALLVLAAIGLVGFLVVPPLFEQISNLLTNLPTYVNNLRDFLTAHGVDKRFTDQLGEVNVPGNLASRVLSASTAALNFLATAGTITIVTVYFVIDARRMDKALYHRLPAKYHHHPRYLLATLQDVVGGYIRGQVVTSTAIAVYTLVLLLILRVPNAIALAFVAAIGDVIPVIGVFVIIAPLAVAALTVSTQAAIIVIVALAVYVWLENNVLFPNVYGKTLSLPPVVVFLAVIVGGKLLGFAGAILSLPLTAGLFVIVTYLWDIRSGKVPLALESEEALETIAPYKPDVHRERRERALRRRRTRTGGLAMPVADTVAEQPGDRTNGVVTARRGQHEEGRR
jgi:predicted PurR-regulated permease PerM